jgi:hypothetical protein
MRHYRKLILWLGILEWNITTGKTFYRSPLVSSILRFSFVCVIQLSAKRCYLKLCNFGSICMVSLIQVVRSGCEQAYLCVVIPSSLQVAVFCSISLLAKAVLMANSVRTVSLISLLLFSSNMLECKHRIFAASRGALSFISVPTKTFKVWESVLNCVTSCFFTARSYASSKSVIWRTNSFSAIRDFLLSVIAYLEAYCFNCKLRIHLTRFLF